MPDSLSEQQRAALNRALARERSGKPRETTMNWLPEGNSNVSKQIIADRIKLPARPVETAVVSGLSHELHDIRRAAAIKAGQIDRATVEQAAANRDASDDPETFGERLANWFDKHFK